MDTNYFRFPAICIAVVILGACFLPFSDLYFFPFIDNVLSSKAVINLLASAFITSIFVGRAAEVFVITLRRGVREEKTAVLESSKTELATLVSATPLSPDLVEQETEEIAKLEKEINLFKRVTVVLATSFTVLFAFAFAVAAIGVRLLEPFFDISDFQCFNGLETEPEECPTELTHIKSYYEWFVRFDVFISTFVIAGGAAGFHSIWSAQCHSVVASVNTNKYDPDLNK